MNDVRKFVEYQILQKGTQVYKLARIFIKPAATIVSTAIAAYYNNERLRAFSCKTFLLNPCATLPTAAVLYAASYMHNAAYTAEFFTSKKKKK